VSHLLSVLHQAGSTTLDGASYGYNFAGNRTSKTNYLNGITSNYGYDAIYELQQVTQGTSTTESYSYDAVGNRLSSLGMNPYSYNTSNELTATPSGSYTYDNNGNTLSDPSGKSYTWDFENRLVQAVVPGTGTVAFKYDPFGRRSQKSSPLGTTNYLYDGDNLVEELDGNANAVAKYTQGLGIDEPFSMLRSGAASYYTADALGSITTLTSSGGSVANTYIYDSFGRLTASTGTLTNPFQYTGRDYDPESGERYYRARYFDPNVGRFVSEDPIRFYGGTNFYRYVRNNPVRYIDRFGLEDLPDACTLCHFFCKLRFAMLTGVNTTWYFGRGLFAGWSMGPADGPMINLFVPIDDPVSVMHDRQETKEQCRRGDLDCHQQCSAKCGVPSPPFPF